MNNTLEVVIDTDTLGRWVDTFDSVVAETRIHVSPDGIIGNPVGPGNVAQVRQELHPRACEHFEATEFTTAVDLTRLSDYVSSGTGDVVELSYNAETRKLDIEHGQASFEFALIDPDEVRQDGEVPDDLSHKFTADVTLEAGAFAHAVKTMDDLSDHIVIDGDPNREDPVIVTADGDLDAVEWGFNNSLQEGSKVDDVGSSMFNQDYLEDMSSVIPKDADLSIQFGNDLPITMQYEYADSGVDVTMMCAPRIQKR